MSRIDRRLLSFPLIVAALSACGEPPADPPRTRAPDAVGQLTQEIVGNGVLEPGEECDDGNTMAGDGCSSTGTVEGGFYCWVPGAACSPTSACGNGQLDSGEACDVTSTNTPGGGCTSECDYADCGNGQLDIKWWPSWQNEVCDDGNRFDGDGCSRLCEVEAAFSCAGEPSRCLLGGVTLFNTGVDDNRQVITSGTDPHWKYSLDGHGAALVGSLAFDWPTISQTSTTLDNYPGHPAADQPGCVYQEFTLPSVREVDTFKVRIATFNDNNLIAVRVNGQDTAYRDIFVPGGGQPWQRVVLREIPSSAPWVVGRNRLEMCNDPDRGGATGFRYIVSDAYDDFCSDGKISVREECDDGNTADGDGCSTTCGIEQGFGCTGAPSACAQTCGNGLLNPGEQCDDGDLTSGDGCSASCRVEAGFTCGTPGQPCQASCGDGVLDPGEQCDDGNTFPADGCEPNCRVRQGWECSGDPSTCNRLCGNGVINSGEQCDDGNRASGDGCTLACTLELDYACPTPGSPCVQTCGNGTVDAGEACDDGGVVSGDGCSSECKVEAGYVCQGNTCTQSCGNGTVDAGEACDDSNLDDDDGCTASCALGDGYTCSCASPQITYVNEALAGRIGGNGGSVGPQMGCSGSDVLIGLAIEWANNINDAVRTRAICGQVTIEAGGTVSTVRTTTQESGGTGCSAWSSAAWSPEIECPSGSAVVGLRGTSSGATLFQELSIVCKELAVDGSSFGPPTILEIPSPGTGSTAQSVDCPEGQIARFFQTRAGCGQDALDLFCGEPVVTCSGQGSVCGTVCGDGTTAGNEQCDDGNGADGDGCSSGCTAEPGFVCPGGTCVNTCGDGTLDAGEACDDGNIDADDGCSPFCTFEAGFNCGSPLGPCDPLCGDGLVVGGEVCDDGNLVADDGCSNACRRGAGQVCTGASECAGVCNLIAGSCANADACGNGVLEAGEACDDGNTASSDGCSASCLLELGASCTIATNCTTGVCDTIGSGACEAAGVCGNGTVDANERCDDGGTVAGDGCSPSCLRETGSACTADGDCATGLCNLAANGTDTCAVAGQCGNGRVETGEACDDGNAADDGDGCSAGCLLTNGTACTTASSCVSGVCDTVGSNTCEPANTCGNGLLETGEICDDGDVATGDGCDASCLLELGESCTAGAQCGSGVCDTRDSGQCEAANVCQNGVEDAGEACDDGNAVDTDLCQNDCTLGAGATCGTNLPCGPGFVCDLDESHACEPVNTCGNGTVEAGESCDDGNTTADGNGCDASCLRPLGTGCAADGECATGVCNLLGTQACAAANQCGNGKVDAGEGCDDGNTTAGDGCDASCDRELGAGCASDGQCASGVCDTVGSNTCETPNTCGNGKLDPAETCDDGNQAPGDGCAPICLSELGQACAVGSDCVSNACHPTLLTCVVLGVCGNGLLDPGEGCDDGNTAGGDDCSATCQVETGASCTGGQFNPCTGVCDTTSGGCEAAGACGNGVVDPGEICDDGNTVDGDGCSATCVSEVGGICQSAADCSNGLCNLTTATCRPAGECGNGLREGTEACDDGNFDNGDGCDFLCQIEIGYDCLSSADCALGLVCDTRGSGHCEAEGLCGNGVDDPGETCDDGNILSGDSCNASCEREDGAACAADGDCASGRCGIDGRCGGALDQSCSQDSDCRGATTCDQPSARCGHPAGDACGSGEDCQSGACSDANVCLEALGASCQAADECASGVCAPDGLCGARTDESCTNRLDCRSLSCDSTVAMCRAPNGETCQVDDDCAGGACDNGTCGLAAGTACLFDGWCLSGLCLTGTTGLCAVAPGEACSTGAECVGGVCAADGLCGTPEGEACMDDAGCRSGFCDPADGLCGAQNGRRCAVGDRCRSGICNLQAGGLCAPTDTCGNGTVEAGEACDDGNVSDLDDCASICLFSVGVACTSSDQCVTGLCEDMVCAEPMFPGTGGGGMGGAGGAGMGGDPSTSTTGAGGAPPVVIPPRDEGQRVAGGACAAGGEQRDPGAWWLLLGLAVAARRRRAGGARRERGGR